MDRLARQADADLKHALALNPKITPAYGAMISLGGMALGRDYALDAVKRGLAQDPGNLHIYDQWMWLEQPNWGGSLDAMSAVAADALKHADRNPMLRMFVTDRDLYRIDKCECTPAVELSAYEAVTETFPGLQTMIHAGWSAKHAGNPQDMTIYFSEALRFSPDLRDVRTERVYDLVEFDRIQWAIEEGTRLIAAQPGDAYAYKARGWAYSFTDNALAQKDLETAVQLKPGDTDMSGILSGIYMQTKQWDKAWELANREIEKNPQAPDGWALRAQIQMQQPRPGLKETADYLESHFYTDRKNLQFNAYIAHLRAVIAGKAKGPLAQEGHG